MLYVETDKPEPVIEELLPILSHKQPKVIAATLDALAHIYHAYGCKTVDPKPALKLLPKVYGHADKNVRAKAQELTVEFYRWLKEAMKPLFWNDLKPVQQQDLDKLFEKVKDEPLQSRSACSDPSRPPRRLLSPRREETRTMAMRRKMLQLTLSPNLRQSMCFQIFPKTTLSAWHRPNGKTAKRPWTKSTKLSAIRKSLKARLTNWCVALPRA